MGGGESPPGTRPVVLWKKVCFSPKTKQTLAIVACAMNDKAARSCTGKPVAAGNDRVPLTHKNSVKRCRLSAPSPHKRTWLAPPTCKSMTIFMRSCHRNDFGRHISKWPKQPCPSAAPGAAAMDRISFSILSMRESKAGSVVVCLHHAEEEGTFELGVSSSVGHCCQHFWWAADR